MNKRNTDSGNTLQSVFLGIAGNAPSLSIAITSGVLIASVGAMAPVAMLVCGFIIFGVLFSYIRLNRESPNCGAAYSWASSIIHPMAGFFAGWCLVVASIFAIISCALSASQATLMLFGYSSSGNDAIVALLAAGWVTVTTIAAIRGMSLVGNLQTLLTIIEVVMLLCLVAAMIYFYHDRLLDFGGISSGRVDTRFASEGIVLAIFFYFGWDVIFNLSEETENTRDASSVAGLAAFSSLVIIFVFFAHAINVILPTEKYPSPADNAFYALVNHLFPEPVGLIAIVAFLISALGAIETSTIQYSRTLFAQSRDGAINNILNPCSPRLTPPLRA